MKVNLKWIAHAAEVNCISQSEDQYSAKDANLLLHALTAGIQAKMGGWLKVSGSKIKNQVKLWGRIYNHAEIYMAVCVSFTERANL